VIDRWYFNEGYTDLVAK